MTVLLRDAIKPNLLQTLEGGPAYVHCGPFANIAHGNSSIIADRVALATSDFVVTEAGFGADMGAEKFFDIKCRASGLRPDAAVVVATVRALKMHGGVGRIVAGKPLDPALTTENVEAVREGGANLAAQVEIVRSYGVPVVVAMNAFPTDTPAEFAAIREVSLAAGARDAVVTTQLRRRRRRAPRRSPPPSGRRPRPRAAQFQPPLPGRDAPAREDRDDRHAGLRRGGRRLRPGGDEGARRVRGASGYGHLPICMAKTHLSLSHDPALKGRPTGFRLPIRDVRLAAGAGFIYPLAGDMRTMPGLPSHPAGEKIDIDADGNVVGLF